MGIFQSGVNKWLHRRTGNCQARIFLPLWISGCVICIRCIYKRLMCLNHLYKLFVPLNSDLFSFRLAKFIFFSGLFC